MSVLLHADGLQVGYRGRAILPAISFSVQPGQVWALAGRNGAGKSTLMKTALGLLPRVGGTLQRAAGLPVAYVPQRSRLDPSVPMRVIDLVRGGLDVGWSFLDPTWRWRQRRRVAEALTVTQTTGLAGRRMTELSEGQKQRALIARALVSQPRLMVLDEPTSAMDPVNEGAIFDLLMGLVEARGLTLVVATHTMSFVAQHASHCGFLDREAGIARLGTSDEVRGDEAFRRHYGVL